MNRSIVLLFFCVLVLSACGERGNGNTLSDTNTDSSIDYTVIVPGNSDTVINDGHNAANSLDWSGTYNGVLSCADCPGINTTISLSGNNTYTIVTKYERKNKIESVSQEGSFIWVDGSTIKLLDRKNEPAFYFVAENKLIQLDLAGKKIKGSIAEKYILTKQ